MDALRAFFEDLAPRWDAQQPDNREAVLLALLAPFAELLQPAQNLLEVGTGTGPLIPCLRAYVPTARIVSIDLAHGMLGRAQRRVPGAGLVQADVHRLPFASPLAGFDIAVCHNSFPHFARMDAALHELRRVLSPGGALLILHDLSRERVNAIHSGAGGAIANDLLPPGEWMQQLLGAAGFDEVWVEDSATCYLAGGHKF